MSTPVTREVEICNQQGLHARPATQFVKLASTFTSQIMIVRGTDRIDAKNILDVLTLAAGQGTKLILEANGDDAESALTALTELVNNGFPIEKTEDKSKQAEE